MLQYKYTTKHKPWQVSFMNKNFVFIPFYNEFAENIILKVNGILNTESTYDWVYIMIICGIVYKSKAYAFCSLWNLNHYQQCLQQRIFI